MVCKQMTNEFTRRERYGFEDLVKIVALLRSENGCPWDKEQDHKSIRRNLIEETYEVAEAIDNEDSGLLREELGDVMLQVVFHAQMEKEAGRFTIDDVADGICKKLVVRHPHVFGEVEANTTEQVLENWDAIKKRTKGQRTQTQVLESVPKVLPALMRSEKVQEKAARVGFDWPDVSGAMDKTREELSELGEAAARGSRAETLEETGDLLFSVVNVARKLGVEPEEALTAACEKFIRRFARMEKDAAQQGRELSGMTPAELDEEWEKAKTLPSGTAEA